jgi:four helix bundle protein
MTNDEFLMTDEMNGRMLTLEAEEAFWAEEGHLALTMRETPPEQSRVYDLEERTALFGEAIIRFALTISQGPVTNRLIDQLVGAGTSVGANYCEADDAYSRNEFRKYIGICKKEARETKFQLRMVVTAAPHLKPQARALWQEAKELHRIFAAILRRTPRQKEQ